MVWPANQQKFTKETIAPNKSLQNSFRPTTTGDEEMKTGFNRVSRSRSRSKNIMERARSFERAAAADLQPSSRPVSRAGSFRNRSPSGNRAHVDEMWTNQIERPSSRTDVDSRRFGEIGRVNTLDWEERIHASTENIPPKTPPPKRREMNIGRNDDERGMATPPPPPPVRSFQKVGDEAFPPPPCSSADSRSKLSEESVSQLVEDNKERIVKQWVESTTSQGDIHRELERFAFDIAESVVSTLEKNSEKKVEYLPEKKAGNWTPCRFLFANKTCDKTNIVDRNSEY